jgi:polysaccharide export outer membrane protein
MLALAGCLALISACASSTAGSIPIDKFPEEPVLAQGEYIIGPGDVLNVQVFEQANMSGKSVVRSDGRITMALLNEVVAAGKTPAALKAELEASLKKLILVPQVTVTVEESSPVSISILGEVNKPGPLQLPRGSGLAQALAAAGGLTNFADRDKMFVNRTTPPARIHFTYDQLTRAVGRAATFRLQSGDVIVVE